MANQMSSSNAPSPTASATSSNNNVPVAPPTPTPTPFEAIKLIQPSQKKNSKTGRLFRSVRSAFRSLPIISSPASCRMPNLPLRAVPSSRHSAIGTLFGHKRSHLSFAVQEHSRSTPLVLISLSSNTSRFLQDLRSSPLLRLSLECEKTPNGKHHSSIRLLEEPVWSASINGKGIGQAVRRDPTDHDIKVMQFLHATSAGAGVLPSDVSDPVDGELTYMRAHFDRVAGSKDSETLYMSNPEGTGGPELTIFFVRI